MKKQNGVTLISLVMYMIGMTIVIATITTITSFVYKNADKENTKIEDTAQFTQFTNYFIKETKKEGNVVVKCETKPKTENTEKTSYIVFSSGNQYTFINNAIYKNEIKICDNVKDCDFSSVYENEKYEIIVEFKTESLDLTGDNAITYYL